MTRYCYTQRRTTGCPSVPFPLPSSVLLQPTTVVVAVDAVHVAGYGGGGGGHLGLLLGIGGSGSSGRGGKGGRLGRAGHPGVLKVEEKDGFRKTCTLGARIGRLVFVAPLVGVEYVASPPRGTAWHVHAGKPGGRTCSCRRCRRRGCRRCAGRPRAYRRGHSCSPSAPWRVRRRGPRRNRTRPAPHSCLSSSVGHTSSVTLRAPHLARSRPRRQARSSFPQHTSPDASSQQKDRPDF